MRYVLAVGLLMLTSCGKESAENLTAEGSPERLKPAVVHPLSPIEIQGRSAVEEMVAQRAQEGLQQKVKKAMEPVLIDAFSAKYRQVRAGRSGAICGQVNAKNRFGAFVGFRDFVLSRDGETVYMSRNTDGVETELYGSFAEAYVNACASEGERTAHSRATAPEEDYWEPSAPSVTDDAEGDLLEAEYDGD